MGMNNTHTHIYRTHIDSNIDQPSFNWMFEIQGIDFPNVPGRPQHGALPGVHMDPKLQELQAGLPPGWEATCQAEALPGLPQWGAVGSGGDGNTG